MGFSNGTRRGPTYIRWASKTAISTEDLTQGKTTHVTPWEELKQSAFTDPQDSNIVCIYTRILGQKNLRTAIPQNRMSTWKRFLLPSCYECTLPHTPMCEEGISGIPFIHSAMSRASAVIGADGCATLERKGDFCQFPILLQSPALHSMLFLRIPFHHQEWLLRHATRLH